MVNVISACVTCTRARGACAYVRTCCVYVCMVVFVYVGMICVVWVWFVRACTQTLQV